MTTKLANVAGRKSVTVAPRQYVQTGSVVFSHPDRTCNSMQPTAPPEYKWAHLTPNARTGT